MRSGTAIGFVFLLFVGGVQSLGSSGPRPGTFCLVPPSFARLAALAAEPSVEPYEVHAVRFATIPKFKVSSLVAGGDATRTLDIAMMVWVIRGAGRTVLVDAGFYREKFMTQWKPVDYRRPSDAVLSALGIRPADVTDIVISHIHWDHADGADLFPKAKVWIQRDEFDHYVGADGAALDRAIDPLVARMLADLRAAGRVMLVDGDDREIMPGIRVYLGGRHTFASQYVGVTTDRGPVVLASDNAYLYENLEQHRAIAQTLDAASNLAAQARMARLAEGGVIVPGHDPAVLTRFPTGQIR